MLGKVNHFNSRYNPLAKHAEQKSSSTLYYQAYLVFVPFRPSPVGRGILSRTKAGIPRAARVHFLPALMLLEMQLDPETREAFHNRLFLIETKKKDPMQRK